MKKTPLKKFRIGPKYLQIIEDYFGDLGIYNPSNGICDGVGYTNLISNLSPMFKPVMTHDDVDYVVYSAVTNVEAELVVGKDLDGDEQRCRQVAQAVLESVISALQSYPRKYSFQLSLPGFSRLPAGEYKIHENVSLELTPNSESRAHLSIGIEGFWRPGVENELTEEFLKKSKIFSFLMHHGPYIWHPIKSRYAVASIKDTESSMSEAVPLPEGMAQLMGTASVNLRSLISNAGCPGSKWEDFTVAMEMHAEKLSKFFEALDVHCNRRIATAIEWYEDARAMTNQTVALLEICIGLEALLGEEEDMADMTKRLRDRFAFTLGRTPTERKELSEQYRDLLHYRGKLVHAKVAKLDHEGAVALGRGYGMLSRLITHELQLAMN